MWVLIGIIVIVIILLSNKGLHIKYKQNEEIIGFKITRIILSAIILIFAAYGLITGNFEFQPFMTFFISLLMFVMGLDEFRRERRTYGWLFIVAFLFTLFVSIQTFLWSY
ncbi:YczI family protein [Oceanobacillus rekensis]|uniref:YczI family protein n=1 Tax=Oceanobacillus rekensis TaxID=937927 RepID=UPI001FE7A3F7|nr:YczI family protein [Oceanobacillus rekensis]